MAVKILIALCLLFVIIGACSMADGGPPDGKCYYTDPIPHYDEC